MIEERLLVGRRAKWLVVCLGLLFVWEGVGRKEGGEEREREEREVSQAQGENLLVRCHVCTNHTCRHWLAVTYPIIALSTLCSSVRSTKLCCWVSSLSLSSLLPLPLLCCLLDPPHFQPPTDYVHPFEVHLKPHLISHISPHRLHHTEVKRSRQASRPIAFFAPVCVCGNLRRGWGKEGGRGLRPT